RALRRLPARVSGPVASSGVLRLLGGPPRRAGAPAASARLDLILARIASRFRENSAVRIDADAAGLVRVAGDEPRLGRAITLVIDHALRHRPGHATVSGRAAAASDDGQVVINAQPSRVLPPASAALRRATTGAGDPLRLRTARRIVDESGGAILLASGSGADVVQIQLRRDG